MAVIFAKSETQVSNSVGTVKSLGGPGAKIRMNLNSIKNASEDAPRLIVTIVNNQGEARVTCSKTVSQAFRAKEIGLSELVNYPITEQSTVDGEIIYVITKPTAQVETSLDSLAETKVETSVQAFEDAAW